ncbi:MAG: hypothetical protein V2A54_05050, partial [Bacteroidota bacterium]
AKYKCEYELNKGMLNGKYVSYYLNGNKKSEGTFAHNLRIGNWKVWDSTGKLRAERDYKNSFEYKRILPIVPEGPAKLFEKYPKYTLQRDSSGCYQWCYLQERSVFYAKRIGRFLDKEKNKNLIKLDSLFTLLLNLAYNNHIAIYSNDEFQVSLKDFKKLSMDSCELIGFKLKEDWFYDLDRMISETRPIGICPIVRYKNKPDEKVSLFWIYYPEIRKYLALCSSFPNSNYSYINTLDDIFFFQQYNSSIYKESNVYDKEIDEKDIPVETLRITLDLIETEHDIWLVFS